MSFRDSDGSTRTPLGTDLISFFVAGVKNYKATLAAFRTALFTGGGAFAATDVVSAVGVAFPAVQVAASDVNTLDDYEEGTWSPSLGGSTTYTTQIGQYVKIGKFVWAAGDIEINVLGSGSTTTISGLPFTVANSPALAATGAVGYYASLAVSVIALMCKAQPNTTTINFSSSAASGASVTNTPAIFGSSARVQFSVCYLASA